MSSGHCLISIHPPPYRVLRGGLRVWAVRLLKVTVYYDYPSRLAICPGKSYVQCCSFPSVHSPTHEAQHKAHARLPLHIIWCRWLVPQVARRILCASTRKQGASSSTTASPYLHTGITAETSPGGHPHQGHTIPTDKDNLLPQKTVNLHYNKRCNGRSRSP
jgi:hypothetical protein